VQAARRLLSELLGRSLLKRRLQRAACVAPGLELGETVAEISRGTRAGCGLVPRRLRQGYLARLPSPMVSRRLAEAGRQRSATRFDAARGRAHLRRPAAIVLVIFIVVHVAHQRVVTRRGGYRKCRQPSLRLRFSIVYSSCHRTIPYTSRKGVPRNKNKKR